MESICVFCGSSAGNKAIYKESALKLGYLIAEKKLSLIYGGGNIGLMGVIADAVLEKKGQVVGVIPRCLQNIELAHEGVSKMYVVNSMHERKALMAQLADAFIALPGGFGTMDELFESLSWNQLEIIKKPVSLLNINGYYDHMIKQLDRMVEDQFVRPEHRKNLIVTDNMNTLFDALKNFKHRRASKWIDELKNM